MAMTDQDRVRLLYEAAAEGNVTCLTSLLHEDDCLLEKSTVYGCLTVLHVTARLGHVGFANEILNRKPSLAQNQDFERRTPIHLVASNGHLEVVKVLVQTDCDACLVRDDRGLNAIHVAVIRGRIEVVKEIIRAKPKVALEINMDRNGTMLHCCVRSSQLEMLQFFVERVENVNEAEFVNLKDDDGFTVLHLAVAEKQVQMVRYLIDKKIVELDAINANGYTALDMAQANHRRNTEDNDIIDILRSAGATTTLAARRNSTVSPGQPKTAKSHDKKDRTRMQWLEQKRSTLMIVASLIATIAFEAGTSVPSSFFDKAGRPSSDPTNAAPPSRYSVPDDEFGVLNYEAFRLSNTIGFFASLYVILPLISGLPLKRKWLMWVLLLVMWVAILSMALAYMYAQLALEKDMRFTWYSQMAWASYTWYAVVIILVIGHIVRLIRKALRFMKKRFERRRASLASV